MGFAAICLMLLGLFVGGALPIAVGLFSEPWDKLVHATFFFVFALLLLRFLGLRLLWVVVIALLIGAADEIHQLFLPGRSAGWDDWFADMTGVLLCALVFKGKKSMASHQF